MRLKVTAEHGLAEASHNHEFWQFQVLFSLPPTLIQLPHSLNNLESVFVGHLEVQQHKRNGSVLAIRFVTQDVFNSFYSLLAIVTKGCRVCKVHLLELGLYHAQIKKVVFGHDDLPQRPFMRSGNLSAGCLFTLLYTSRLFPIKKAAANVGPTLFVFVVPRNPRVISSSEAVFGV